ncbi:MAG: hypothetical protein IIC31_07345, partial [Chloroflexi bacterium]|nr:hypothetical protein [Chloroflexota bacterium]
AGTTSSIILLAARETITASILVLEWLMPGARLREEAAVVQIILGAITLIAAFVARRYGITVGVRHQR